MQMQRSGFNSKIYNFGQFGGYTTFEKITWPIQNCHLSSVLWNEVSIPGKLGEKKWFNCQKNLQVGFNVELRDSGILKKV